jgi:hypothetical protein
MKIVKWFVALNILAVAVLVFWFPEVMITPGRGLVAHQGIAGNCFNCHTAWGGADAAKCETCHKVAEIGKLTSKGVPITGKRLAFLHSQLQTVDCGSCHLEHMTVKRPVSIFDHALLSAGAQEKCTSCHQDTVPKTGWHKDFAQECASCHTTQAWKPARFKHDLLKSGLAAPCETCHIRQVPSSGWHNEVRTDCSKCHSTQAWKPATFDHQKFWPLDRDHQASCVTCHTNPASLAQYTCYGCHEHTPANIQRKHEREGMKDLEKCADCHGPKGRSSGRGGEHSGERSEGGGKQSRDRSEHGERD